MAWRFRIEFGRLTVGAARPAIRQLRSVTAYLMRARTRGNWAGLADR